MVLPLFFNNNGKVFMFIKVYLTAVMLLVVCVSVFAAAPTDGVNDAIYEWGVKTTISSTTNDDSLVAATDSVILLSNYVPERGFEYIWVRDAHSGTGSDSSYYEVIVRAYDASGNLLYSVTIDTVTALTGEAIKIPFGETILGSKFKLIAKAVSGSTGIPVIFNRSYIYTRRPVVNQRPWN